MTSLNVTSQTFKGGQPTQNAGPIKKTHPVILILVFGHKTIDTQETPCNEDTKS